MNIHVLGRFAPRVLEQAQPLHVRVLLLGEVDQFPVQVVQRGEQRHRAVTDVIVRLGADVPVPQPHTYLQVQDDILQRAACGKTIRARSPARWDVVGARTRCSRISFSSAVSSRTEMGLAISRLLPSQPSRHSIKFHLIL